ncbi:MAG TPA: amidohydrolase family protein [Candidatus Acidoferrales bacterium]|nr:amidohydrolase family protein [Candidatus Acidoferrales bacterium]
MIIDCHSHALPIELAKLLEEKAGIKPKRQGLWDEKERLEAMDRGKIDKQLLTYSAGKDFYANPDLTPACARAVNDGLAMICRKRPDRFLAFSTLPLNSPAEAIAELDRATQDLGLRGVSVPSNVRGVTLDDLQFHEIFARMNELKLAVFVHPVDRDDFPAAWRSFRLDHYIGWPVDTAISLCKMICSGMLDRFCDLTWVVSHLGGPIPAMMARIDRSYRDGRAQKRPATYLKSFYYDTAGPSHAGALVGAVHAVGVDRIVFGTDLPWGQEGDYVERALACVEEAGLSRDQKELIYSGNAKKILKL